MFAATIMAHEARAQHVHYLQRELQSQATPHWDIGAVWDSGRGVWDTAARAWERTDARFRLILQDDVIPATNLLDTVASLALEAPDAVWGLFYPWPLPVGGERWFTPIFPWTQAVVLPIAVAEKARAWCDANEPHFPMWEDRDNLRLAAYCRHAGVEVRVLKESYVEHIDDETLPSLVDVSNGRRATKRAPQLRQAVRRYERCRSND